MRRFMGDHSAFCSNIWSTVTALNFHLLLKLEIIYAFIGFYWKLGDLVIFCNALSLSSQSQVTIISLISDRILMSRKLRRVWDLMWQLTSRTYGRKKAIVGVIWWFNWYLISRLRVLSASENKDIAMALLLIMFWHDFLRGDILTAAKSDIHQKTWSDLGSNKWYVILWIHPFTLVRPTSHHAHILKIKVHCASRSIIMSMANLPFWDMIRDQLKIIRIANYGLGVLMGSDNSLCPVFVFDVFSLYLYLLNAWAFYDIYHRLFILCFISCWCSILSDSDEMIHNLFNFTLITFFE